MYDLLSDRARAVRRSEIRELLKLAEKPGLISFAGGFPDPETFPKEEFALIAQEVLKEDYRRSLQYGATEGDKRFRKSVIDWLEGDGLNPSLEEVTVASGSQQGLDLVSKVFLNPGDVVLCGLPTYLGAIQAFTAFQAEKIGIPLESDGMDLDVLELKIKECLLLGKQPRLIYLVPDFQNPSGVTMSEEKRKKVLEMAERHNLVIIEDNPYGKLRYEGEEIRLIKSLDNAGRVVMLVTFSKLLCPGLRLAVLVAAKEVTEQIVKLKQPTDLCASSLTQSLAYHFFVNYDFPAHVEKLKRVYREKRNAMLEAMELYLPEHPEISWTRPEGGLFIWLTLPPDIDTEEMFKKSIERNVAYVIGRAFHVDGSGRNTIRLSFSEPSLEAIREGIKRLGQVIDEEISVSSAMV